MRKRKVFKSRVKEVCKDMGITQQRLAFLYKIAYQTLNQKLNNPENLKGKDIARFCQILNKNFDELFYIEEI